MRLCLFPFVADELASFAMRKAEILANKYGKLNYHIGGKLNNYLILSIIKFLIACKYVYIN